MDEPRKTNRKKEKQTKKQRDYFLFVSLVQVAFCAFLALIVFVCAKTNADSKASLSEDFQLLMGWEIQKEDVSAVVAQVREYFISAGDAVPVFGGVVSTDEAATSAEADDATEPATFAEATTEADDATAAEPTTASAAETETTAVQPKKTVKKNADADGAGGEDVSTLEAKENTSFSPTATTVPIVRPVSGGRYSSKFGYRTNPITHAYSFHTGLDIAVPYGSKIHAAYHGQVRKVGEDDHAGKYIFVAHDDGYETFYCHCSEITAAEGDVVRAGDVIAKVGSTGWSTGPHLHFEVRKNNERLDPLPLLEHDD